MTLKKNIPTCIGGKEKLLSDLKSRYQELKINQSESDLNEFNESITKVIKDRIITMVLNPIARELELKNNFIFEGHQLDSIEQASDLLSSLLLDISLTQLDE